MSSAQPPANPRPRILFYLALFGAAALLLILALLLKPEPHPAIVDPSPAAVLKTNSPQFSKSAQAEPFGFDALIAELFRALNEPPEPGTPVSWHMPHRWRLNPATINAVRAFRGEDQVVFETLTNALATVPPLPRAPSDRVKFARATLAMTLLSTNTPGLRDYLWSSLDRRTLSEATLQALITLGLSGADLPRLCEALVANQNFRFRIVEAVNAAFAADPTGAAANLASFEARLSDETSSVRYFAACILARHGENISPAWLTHVAGNLSCEAWAPSSFGVQTLAALGPAASSALPALQEHHATLARAARYPSVEESLRRQEEVILAILAIDPNAANNIPAVADYLAQQQRAARFAEQFDNGAYQPADLLTALTDPHLARIAIDRLAQLPAATPDISSALIQGLNRLHDSSLKDRLFQIIQTLDPSAPIRRVNSEHIYNALDHVTREFSSESNPNSHSIANLVFRAREELQDGSTWFTDQNLRDLHSSLASRDPQSAAHLTQRLLELDPSLANLFAEPFAANR